MNYVAEFQITMKTIGKTDHAKVVNAGIAVAVDWRVDRTQLGESELDRAFAAIRKMYADARQIALVTVARWEETPK